MGIALPVPVLAVLPLIVCEWEPSDDVVLPPFDISAPSLLYITLSLQLEEHEDPFTSLAE